MEYEYVDISESIGFNDELNELSSSINNTDECLKRFIHAYEAAPELWNKFIPSYLNRHKKQAALQKLLVIYKEIKPTATIKDVTKKLNILRTNFRRELNRIKNSMSSELESDAVYKPTSWVFYELQFLQDSESLSPLTNQNKPFEKPKNRRTSLSSMTSYRPTVKRKKNEIFQMDSCNYSSSSAYEDNEFLNIALVWANKLKSLEPLQRIFAEKAVNDILFEAEMQTLHRESVKINMPIQIVPDSSCSLSTSILMNSPIVKSPDSPSI